MSENVSLIQLATHLSHKVVYRSSTSFDFYKSAGGSPVSFSINLKAVLVLGYLLQLIQCVPPDSSKGIRDKPPAARPRKVNAIRRLKDVKGFALIIEPNHALWL